MPKALRIIVAIRRVAIAIPDTGLLEEPTRPTIRADTVAKKKPKKPIIEPTVVLKGKQQLIQKVKVGDRITMRRPALDKDFEDKERERVFTVIGIYPNHVLGVDVKTGSKRCISYGDLIKKGLEHQADKLEALRK